MTMLTVAEAAKKFFQGKASKNLLYDMVKKNQIPHVRMAAGKILFDEERLTEWWQEQLESSTKPARVKRII